MSLFPFLTKEMSPAFGIDPAEGEPFKQLAERVRAYEAQQERGCLWVREPPSQARN